MSNISCLGEFVACDKAYISASEILEWLRSFEPGYWIGRNGNKRFQRSLELMMGERELSDKALEKLYELQPHIMEYLENHGF